MIWTGIVTAVLTGLIGGSGFFTDLDDHRKKRRESKERIPFPRKTVFLAVATIVVVGLSIRDVVVKQREDNAAEQRDSTRFTENLNRLERVIHKEEWVSRNLMSQMYPIDSLKATFVTGYPMQMFPKIRARLESYILNPAPEFDQSFMPMCIAKYDSIATLRFKDKLPKSPFIKVDFYDPDQWPKGYGKAGEFWIDPGNCPAANAQLTVWRDTVYIRYEVTGRNSSDAYSDVILKPSFWDLDSTQLVIHIGYPDVVDTAHFHPFPAGPIRFEFGSFYNALRFNPQMLCLGRSAANQYIYQEDWLRLGSSLDPMSRAPGDLGMSSLINPFQRHKVGRTCRGIPPVATVTQ